MNVAIMMNKEPVKGVTEAMKRTILRKPKILTRKKRLFAQYVVEGYNYTQAYLKASENKCQYETAKKGGYIWANQYEVAAEIERIKVGVTKTEPFTIAKKKKILEEMILNTDKSNTPANRLKALEMHAKFSRDFESNEGREEKENTAMKAFQIILGLNGKVDAASEKIEREEDFSEEEEEEEEEEERE